MSEAHLYDPKVIAALAARVRELAAALPRAVTLMEVCGTHTHAIAAAGLRRLLPATVRLVSGPGCPVCVTPVGYVDRAVALAGRAGTLVTTFGDLMRVPGSERSLEEARAEGGQVEVVYSPRDALRRARELPDRTVVFLAVGFETTAPTIAAALVEAEGKGAAGDEGEGKRVAEGKRATEGKGAAGDEGEGKRVAEGKRATEGKGAARSERIANFEILAGMKTMPGPLGALAGDPDLAIDGFLLPGHVSVITGSDAFGFLATKHHRPSVVVGFTPADVLRGVEALLAQIVAGETRMENLYGRVVTGPGNRTAQALLEVCFQAADADWRGLGSLPGSGLALRPHLAHRDATRHEVTVVEPREPAGCRCGEVLRGTLDPPGCGLFGTRCTPDRPVGACMVSGEGACAAWLRHGLGTPSPQRTGTP